MWISVPADFINLDLELNSALPMPELVAELAKRGRVLFHGQVADAWRVVFESCLVGADAARCTRKILALLAELPETASRQLAACDSRIFDYGFEGGLESKAFSAILDTGLLRAIAALAAQIKFTVYPLREEQA